MRRLRLQWRGFGEPVFLGSEKTFFSLWPDRDVSMIAKNDIRRQRKEGGTVSAVFEEIRHERWQHGGQAGS